MMARAFAMIMSLKQVIGTYTKIRLNFVAKRIMNEKQQNDAKTLKFLTKLSSELRILIKKEK